MQETIKVIYDYDVASVQDDYDIFDTSIDVKAELFVEVDSYIANGFLEESFILSVKVDKIINTNYSGNQFYFNKNMITYFENKLNDSESYEGIKLNEIIYEMIRPELLYV